MFDVRSRAQDQIGSNSSVLRRPCRRPVVGWRHWRPGEAASYIDRILRGANLADLPVELPTK